MIKLYLEHVTFVICYLQKSLTHTVTQLTEYFKAIEQINKSLLNNEDIEICYFSWNIWQTCIFRWTTFKINWFSKTSSILWMYCNLDVRKQFLWTLKLNVQKVMPLIDRIPIIGIIQITCSQRRNFSRIQIVC